MKQLIKLGAMCALLTAVGAAFASGNHAGGHDHHDEASVGQVGVASSVNRTVTVDMSDAMRFTPSGIKVKQGETIRFVIKNSGQLKHEFVLGNGEDLKAHYEMMKKNPEMEHADDNMVTVKPGDTGEILWKFTKAGKVEFACLQVGHFDAGMKGSVSVSPSKTKPAATK